MAKANKMDASDSAVKEWLPQFERLQTFLPRIKTLDAQIAKSPNDPAAAGLLLDRARLFTLAGRPLLALDDAERALKLQPASMRARIQTAEALWTPIARTTPQSWTLAKIFSAKRTSMSMTRCWISSASWTRVSWRIRKILEHLLHARKY
jgi:hypothetical protein